ncbi:hypothetical protein GALL_233330 [mine drainage metagenome]|uniref:DNA-binding protein n=1 Tax=mine drainage metagenome TaxID=410659 RepID=A0A1J5RYU0_9ZZZZ
MSTFAFTATVTGLDLDDVDQLEALRTGAFVLVPGEIDGVTSISVEVDAPSGEEALKALVDHVARVAPNLTFVRVDEDLVNIPEVALRLDLSREAVRLLVSGARGDGDFPRHRTIVGQQKLWAWSEVHAWAQVHGRLSDDEPNPLDAACVDWFNGQLVPMSERAPATTEQAIWTLLVVDRPWATTWTRGRGGATLIGDQRRHRSYDARTGQAWRYDDGSLRCDDDRNACAV